jgi:hypothetical protein
MHGTNKNLRKIYLNLDEIREILKEELAKENVLLLDVRNLEKCLWIAYGEKKDGEGFSRCYNTASPTAKR